MKILLSPNHSSAISASISSRDLSQNMIRVRSSNVYSIAADIRDANSNTCTLLVRFKDNNQPGDLYQYFDVPVKLYKKWLNSPSKGHFFWAYIRNYYPYRKLTGDKRGKLSNAIN